MIAPWHAPLHRVSVMLALLLATVCAAQAPQNNNERSTADDALRKYYMLQVGIFRRSTNADTLIERLKAANFGFFQRETIKVRGKTRYRVRVGPFASSDQAEEARSALEKLGMEPLLVVKHGTPPPTVAQPRQARHRIVGVPPATARAAPAPQATVAAPTQQQTGQAQQPAGKAPQQTSQAPPNKVGQAPPAKQPEKAPQVQAIAELGGVLTPKGSLIIEPLFEYTNSQVNRATFQGVEIATVALIGVFEIEDADRDVTSASLTGRYGITDRLELEVKVPYISRDDKLTATIPQAETAQGQPPTIESSLQGEGVGDVEVALHYQLNRGLNGWPFLVGNLRYKSDTGEGPFDVDRDAGGNETELATGSGFEAIEPSLTVLYPSDPGMFFANVGYLFALKNRVDKTFGEQSVGNFESGDTIRINFGMAYAINNRASFMLGYKQDFIDQSEVEINDIQVASSDLKVGSFLLGFALQPTAKVSVNLNLEFGVTADAPDVRVTLSLPYAF